MVAYLLDTNHASPLLTQGHPLRERVRDRVAAGDTFAIGVPVLTETLFGISLLPRALQNRSEWGRHSSPATSPTKPTARRRQCCKWCCANGVGNWRPLAR